MENNDREWTQHIEYVEAQTRQRAIDELDKYKNPDGSGWMVLMWSPWLLEWMRVALIWHPSPELFEAAQKLAEVGELNVAIVNVWNVWDDHPIQFFETSVWHGRD